MTESVSTDLECTRFEVLEYVQPLVGEDDLDGEEMTFGLSPRLRAGEDFSFVELRVTLRLSIQKAEGPLQIGRVTTEFDFDLGKGHNLAEGERNPISLGVLKSILNYALSGTRGVWVAKSLGTVQASFLMPFFDTSSMAKDIKKERPVRMENSELKEQSSKEIEDSN